MAKKWFEIATLAAVIVGIFLGIFLPDSSKYFAFIGQIFLSLLKVLILPIIILSLFLAIVRIPSIQGLKSLGYKTIIYYLSTSVEEVVGFVLPLGATLNMDGSALYQALLAMFFVSLSGIEISFGQQILVFLFIILSSAGSAGIPSGGIVMMTMVIQLLEISNAEYYLGLCILVDRFWDYPITTINVWGDLIAQRQ